MCIEKNPSFSLQPNGVSHPHFGKAGREKGSVSSHLSHLSKSFTFFSSLPLPFQLLFLAMGQKKKRIFMGKAVEQEIRRKNITYVYHYSGGSVEL